MADPAQPGSGRYVVVARRYRPRGFSQLVGQDHVAKALANAIETGRVGHAYLFTGARGVGKTSTARIFAKALNAPEGPTVTPDDSSDVCQAIDAGEDIDVLEIDGASNRGIDEIRQLRAGVGVRPSRSRYKIYIIDEVHMLTTQAFNALLKTLEEPPEHVKFIFCTTDPEKIPITVLSRCQRFDFAPVRMEEIAGRLREIVDAEGVEAEDEALRLLARRAAGSMRDSQSLLEQVLSFSSGKLTVHTVHSMLGTADDSRLAELAQILMARQAHEALQRVDQAVLEGVDAGQLAEQLLGFFRDMMTAAVGCDAEMLRFCGPSLHSDLREWGQQLGLQTILAIVALLDQTLVRIRQSVHGQILLEATIVQICSLPDLEGIAKLATALAESSAGEKKNVSPVAAARAVGGMSAARPSGPNPSPSTRPSESSTRPAGSAATAPSSSPATSSPVSAARVSGSETPAAAPVAAAHKSTAGATSAPAASSTGATTAGSVSAGRQVEVGPASGAGVASEDGPPAERRLVVSPTAAWDQQSATTIWRAALAALDDMTADFARQSAEIQAFGDNRLRLIFPADKELAKRSCEKPERKSKLEEAIRSVSARQVLIECQTRAGGEVAAKEPRPSNAVNRRQRMRDAEQHPGVRQAIEMFEAEIVRIDEPRV